MSRTPIVVEGEACAVTHNRTYGQQKLDFSTPVVKRTVSAKASNTLSNIDTSTTAEDADGSDDPRSPTVTVPRTPLEDKTFGTLTLGQSCDAVMHVNGPQ